MRISELIAELEKIKDTHGNLQIRSFDDYDVIHNVHGVHAQVNHSGRHSWETDEDLGDGETYAAIV